MDEDYDGGWSMVAQEGQEERPPQPSAQLAPEPQLVRRDLAPVQYAGAPLGPQPLPLGPPPQLVPYQAPLGQFEQENGHILGLSILATGIGTAVGAVYGGLGGSIAGALAAGSAINLYRVYRFYGDGTEDGTKEAVVSGTYAVLTGVAAGVVWWKFGGKGRMVRNPDDVRAEREAQAPCAIRRVGP